MADSAAKPVPDGDLFKEINALNKATEQNKQKYKSQDDIDKEKEHAKLNNTCWARLVKSKVQEISTLSVIILNALFIGYDTDYTARWERPDGLYNQGSRWGFPFMENFFCVYFTGEVTIRFFAFRDKKDCMWDGWFVFDSVLVGIMIMETWVLELVGGDGLPLPSGPLRLLRLLRITRMGKLMRFFPELQVIVKGMVAAIRSVGCTAILMILCLYVFSIIFTDMFHQGKLKDDDKACEGIEDCKTVCEGGELEGCTQELFGSMGKSMRHLFIMGTILDDITACTNSIRASPKPMMGLGFFFVFVLVSSFTMLNMLIGILCEVVGQTSEDEEQKATEANIREAIGSLFKTMDEDGNGTISRHEFMAMKEDKAVLDSLSALDVQARHFDMYADLMFAPPEPGVRQEPLTLEKMINMIMRLRPGSKVSALDFASFQQAVFKNHSFIKQQIMRIDRMMTKCIPYNPEEEDAFSSEMKDETAPLVTLEDIKQFSNEDILREIQKRGVSTLPKYEALIAKYEAFDTLCVPQNENDEEAWLKETYTC